MSDIFDVPTHTPTVLAPEGKFPAVLYLLADLGIHRDTFDGKEVLKHKIYISFELVGTKMEDGRPFVIGKEMVVSPSQFKRGDYYFAKTSNIYKMLKSWSGKDKVRTDPGILVGLLEQAYPAYVTVEHLESVRTPGKINAVIGSVRPYKEKKELKRFNAPIDALSKREENFDKLPEWMQKKINARMEINGGVPDSYYQKDEFKPGDQLKPEPDIPF